MIDFLSIHPLSCVLLDENGRNVLHMSENADQRLTMEVKNESGRSMQLEPLFGEVGPDNHHLSLQFRQGVLSAAASELRLDDTSAQSWGFTGPIMLQDGSSSIYFGWTGESHEFDPGDTLRLTLENISAQPGQEIYGTKVRFLTRQLTYAHESETRIDGARTLFMHVGHPHKRHALLHLALKIDEEKKMLSMKLANLAEHVEDQPEVNRLTFRRLEDSTSLSSRIVLAFQEFKDVNIYSFFDTNGPQLGILSKAPDGWELTEERGSTGDLQWVLTPTTDFHLQGQGVPEDLGQHTLEIDIDTLRKVYASGTGHLIVRFENLEGYWDGQQIFQIGESGGTEVVDTEVEALPSLPTSWDPPVLVQAENTTPNDGFGHDVAISNDWAIIGKRSDNAQVLRKVEGTWKVVDSLKPVDCKGQFGFFVDIDDEWAVVGAPYSSGSIHLYHLENNRWTERQAIRGPGMCGVDACISGEWMISSAYSQHWKGEVVFYKYEQGAWTEKQKIKGKVDKDWFGEHVAISGGWAVAGARMDDAKGENAGAAYVFKLEGDTWINHQTLYADETEQNDSFGQALTIDGEWLVIGSPGENTGGRQYTGSAYAFRLINGQWVEQQKLHATDTRANGAQYGSSLSLCRNQLIVGVPWDNYTRGSVYVYHLEDEIWIQRKKFLIDGMDAFSSFGRSVDNDGQHLMISAPGSKKTGGRIYLYEASFDESIPE